MQDTFNEMGFVVVPDFLRELVDRVRERFPAVPEGASSTFVRTAAGEPDEAWLAEPARELLMAIVGCGDWECAFAQWYAKPVGAPEARIPWHQDRFFWSVRRPPTATLWLALDEASQDSGCLQVVPGSHRARELRRHEKAAGGPVPTCAVAAQEPTEWVEVPMGGAVIYHERLVHGSGGNRTCVPRRALVTGWTRAVAPPLSGAAGS